MTKPTAAPDKISEFSNLSKALILMRQIPLSDTGSTYWSSTTELEEFEIGEKITGGIIKGNDADISSGSLNEYKVKGEIYSIKGVNRNYAVAVKFQDFPEYMLYTDWEYTSETLGGMIDDFDLKNRMIYGNFHNKTADEVYNVDNDFIWNVFLADTDAPYCSIDTAGLYDYSLSVDVAGLSGTYIGISKDGYIMTNIVETGAAFYIGVERANEIIEYLKNNYKLQ